MISALLSRNSLTLWVITLATAITTSQAHAQLYVSDSVTNTVAEYDLSTGNPIASPLINNLSNPMGLSVEGNTLYVVNNGVNTIARYNATTGAGIGSNPFISTGLNKPVDIYDSGSSLYVTNFAGGNITVYNPLTGALTGTIGSSLGNLNYLAASGNDLYASNGNAVYEFNTTTNTQVGSGPLLSNLTNAKGIAINGNDLYVADTNLGTITVYNATTGAKIGGSPLVSGLTMPGQLEFYNGDLFVVDGSGISVFNSSTGQFLTNYDVAGAMPGCDSDINFTIAGGNLPVPEPSTWAMLAGGIAALVFITRRRALAFAPQPTR